MRVLAVMLTGLMLAACARPGGAGMAEGGENEVSEGLAATMEVKVGGEGVRLALHVTNTRSRPVEFTFPTSQRYDFAIRGPSGEEVWRWSEGMAFLQAISHATLEPGESWDMEAVWDPAGESGVLEAVGWLTAQGHRARQSTTFEVP